MHPHIRICSPSGSEIYHMHIPFNHHHLVVTHKTVHHKHKKKWTYHVLQQHFYIKEQVVILHVLLKYFSKIKHSQDNPHSQQFYKLNFDEDFYFVIYYAWFWLHFHCNLFQFHRMFYDNLVIFLEIIIHPWKTSWNSFHN